MAALQVSYHRKEAETTLEISCHTTRRRLLVRIAPDSDAQCFGTEYHLIPFAGVETIPYESANLYDALAWLVETHT